MANIEKQAQLQQDEQTAELARKVRSATLEQIKSMLAADTSTLLQRTPESQLRLEEQAKDLKYIKDRQKRSGVL